MAGDSYARFGTKNMTLPPEGPVAYPFKLDFTNTNQQVLDFTSEIQRGFVSWIQSVIVDNTLNANPLTITPDNLNFPWQIPAGVQMSLPIFVAAPVLTFTTVQAVNLVVPLIVTNVPVQPYTWTP